jgi:hypothetical protein
VLKISRVQTGDEYETKYVYVDWIEGKRRVLQINHPSFPPGDLPSHCSSLLFEIDGPVSPLSSVAQLLFPSSIALIGML